MKADSKRHPRRLAFFAVLAAALVLALSTVPPAVAAAAARRLGTDSVTVSTASIRVTSRGAVRTLETSETSETSKSTDASDSAETSETSKSVVPTETTTSTVPTETTVSAEATETSGTPIVVSQTNTGGNPSSTGGSGGSGTEGTQSEQLPFTGGDADAFFLAGLAAFTIGLGCLTYRPLSRVLRLPPPRA